MYLPRVFVPPEVAALFVQLESLSTFVLMFCALPFRLIVLYYSHEEFAQLHSPIRNGQFMHILVVL